MDPRGSMDDIERQGIDLATQGRFLDAAPYFEQAARARSNPDGRAIALRNVLLAYDRGGRRDQAIEVAERILAIPGLGDTPGGAKIKRDVEVHLSILLGVKPPR